MNSAESGPEVDHVECGGLRHGVIGEMSASQRTLHDPAVACNSHMYYRVRVSSTALRSRVGGSRKGDSAVLKLLWFACFVDWAKYNWVSCQPISYITLSRHATAFISGRGSLFRVRGSLSVGPSLPSTFHCSVGVLIVLPHAAVAKSDGFLSCFLS